jgi:hypothetical protein
MVCRLADARRMLRVLNKAPFRRVLFFAAVMAGLMAACLVSLPDPMLLANASADGAVADGNGGASDSAVTDAGLKPQCATFDGALCEDFENGFGRNGWTHEVDGSALTIVKRGENAELQYAQSPRSSNVPYDEWQTERPLQSGWKALNLEFDIRSETKDSGAPHFDYRFLSVQLQKADSGVVYEVDSYVRRYGADETTLGVIPKSFPDGDTDGGTFRIQGLKLQNNVRHVQFRLSQAAAGADVRLLLDGSDASPSGTIKPAQGTATKVQVRLLAIDNQNLSGTPAKMAIDNLHVWFD